MERKSALDKLTFISGGQTGIDRAVLDFCLSKGLRCGGWCPEGRTAEDGTIDLKYPLRELPGASYEERTLANVADGDATVILFHGTLSGGTLRSHEFARKLNKPVLLIDLEELPREKAAARFLEFVRQAKASKVNFSGPRQSEWSKAYDRCISFLTAIYCHEKTPSDASNGAGPPQTGDHL
jgi:hypothetical protein